MDKATQKSIEWQKATHPMAIGGDAFADIVDSFNVNPAFIAGYKEAEEDLALTWEDVKKIEDLCMEVATLFASVGRNKVILEPPFYEEVARRFNSQRENK